jgi:hypothetical protein
MVCKWFLTEKQREPALPQPSGGAFYFGAGNEIA